MNLSEAFRRAFAPPDRRPIYQWGEENVGKPPGWTRAFSIQSSRHFIAPFDALRSEFVRECNVMAPVQSGKSLIAEVSVCYLRQNDPGSFLWLFQTDAMAKQYAETRGKALLDSIPGIVSLYSAGRHQTRTQEIIFADGLQLLMWGPSLSNLQTFGYRYVICDELWRWKSGTLKEAKGRLTAFVKMQLDKLLCISQGGTNGDDWDNQFNSGELNEWHVQCQNPACGHYMCPKWSAFRPDGSRWGMMFDAEKDSDGEYDFAKAQASIRFECEKCGHAHTDTEHTRAAWNLTGEYRVMGQPSVTHKSYHWNAIVDMQWGLLVKEWLEARSAASQGNYEPTIQFCQKRLAEPKSETTVHEGTQSFARYQVATDAKWDKEYARIVTVDRQIEDVYWLTVRAWAKAGGESRRLAFRKVHSESEIKAVVEEFQPSRITIRVGTAAAHVNHAMHAVFIDSGYQPRGDAGVYAMCARNNWGALKGTSESNFLHEVIGPDRKPAREQRPYAQWIWRDPGAGTSDQGRGTPCPLLRFSSDSMANIMQGLIDKGLWVEPEGDDEADLGREYARQMASEYRKPRRDKFTGREEMIWVCPSGNNHARDCGKMQTVAAKIIKVI